MALRRRPHQRRLAAPVLDRRSTDAPCVSSAFAASDVARARAGVERRFAQRPGGVRAHAGLEQALDDRRRCRSRRPAQIGVTP